MNIIRLTIENFGVFKGKHEFDLSPHPDINAKRPVILFGGKNGAGKTTLFEAVRLCLYGRYSLGIRNRDVNYNTHILEKIHRSKDGVLHHNASVGISFEHTHSGVKSFYDANRMWDIDASNVHETLIIYKDGRELQDIDREHWNDFLRDLIPPGVADLFFFDGEQIQQLADEETESKALETAIKGLLNLDLVERLRSDLTIYVRQQERKEHSQLQQLAEELQADFVKLDARLGELRQDRAGLKTTLDRNNKLLNDARQTLTREGAGFLKQRSNLEARQAEVTRLLEQTRNSIRELANDLLPFAVAPKWSQKLSSRLQQEIQIERLQLLAESQDDQAAKLFTQLLDRNLQKRVAPKVDPQDWARIGGEIVALLTAKKDAERTPLLHPLSAQQRDNIVQWIHQVHNEVPKQIANLSKQLEDLENEQTALQTSLRQIPDEAVANPIIESFHQLSVSRGETTEQYRIIENQIHQLEVQLDDLDRQRKKLWSQMASSGDADQRIKRAAQVQLVLDEYLARITEIKLQELEVRVAEYFNILCHKQMLVKSVMINPDTYKVTLFTEQGTVLPKSSLSAGERQLYAMALLWALRSVSGRTLPIIVDTPMGRLDRDHRYTLLTRFFPSAAHQIILLSTDTEIDENNYLLLQPSIARVYLLAHDDSQGYTRVEQRYFTNNMEQTS